MAVVTKKENLLLWTTSEPINLTLLAGVVCFQENFLSKDSYSDCILQAILIEYSLEDVTHHQIVRQWCIIRYTQFEMGGVLLYLDENKFIDINNEYKSPELLPLLSWQTTCHGKKKSAFKTTTKYLQEKSIRILIFIVCNYLYTAFNIKEV